MDRVAINKIVAELIQEVDIAGLDRELHKKIRLALNYTTHYMWERDQEIAELKLKRIEQSKEISQLKRRGNRLGPG